MPSPASQSSALAHARNTIFTKTAKGRDEISRRSAALSARQRAILIMLDGSKRLHAVNTMMPELEVASIVHFLEAQQYITADQPAKTPPIRAASGARAALPDARQTNLPGSGTAHGKPPRTPIKGGSAQEAPRPMPSVSAQTLRDIKDFMNAKTHAYLGLMGTDVVRRVEHANDAVQLMSVLGHWHMALRESKNGKLHAAGYLEQVKASFHLAPSQTPAQA